MLFHFLKIFYFLDTTQWWIMGHWDYTQQYRCCFYLKIRPLGQPSKTGCVSVQLYAVCHREEEGWGVG